MQRVVIDTNVLVRAFLKSGGSDDKVFRLFVRGDVKLYYSLYQIEEFLKVLYYPRIKRRLVFDHGQVELLVRLMTADGYVVVPRETDVCRDKNDNLILGTALASVGRGKTYLITDDKDLLVLKGRVGGVEIVRSGEFLRVVEVGAKVR